MFWTYYRDKIILDQQFQSWFDEQEIQEKTILLAARNFKVNGHFKLIGGKDLVILADQFDGRMGHIECHGRKNKYLIPPYDHLKGPDITVICKELTYIKATSKGGDGIDGKPGKDGKDGRDGLDANKANSIDGRPGFPGEDGENGECGGSAENGGNISVSYMTAIGCIVLCSIPGKPGKGGRGGKGGSGGCGGKGNYEEFGSDGADGLPGKDGRPGLDGRPGHSGDTIQEQISEDEYWGMMRLMATHWLPDWAEYRLRVGEYYYRAYIPQGERLSYLKIAAQEFDSVLALDPDNEQAQRYKNQLCNNQVFPGFPRDYDLIPDFDRYEKFLTDYDDMVFSLSDSIEGLIGEIIDSSRLESDLNREISHYAGMVNQVLPNEHEEAERAKAAAELNRAKAAERVLDIQNRIEECKNREIGFFDVMIPIVSIVGAVASITSGGVGLVAAVPSIIGTVESISEVGIDILNLSDEQKKLLKETAGGLKELANFTGGIIDLHKAVKDFSQVTSDYPECKRLAEQAVELAHEKLLAELREQQTDALLKAANQRINLANKELEAAREARDNLSEELTQQVQAINWLIKISLGYMDILMEYNFFAARTLEIYALKDCSEIIRFDYGYIHPDKEKDLRESCSVSDLSTFFREYIQSLHEFKKFMNLKDEYEKYRRSGDLHQGFFIMSFHKDEDQAVINRFQEAHEIQFTINISDLPSSRYETKVNSISVSLVGVKAASENISCFVEHSGLCELKNRNEETIIMTLDPRKACVNIEGESGHYDEFSGTWGTEDPFDLGFWGRGVATTWRLFIEREEVLNIDLDKLSEIQIKIGYKFFYVPNS